MTHPHLMLHRDQVLLLFRDHRQVCFCFAWSFLQDFLNSFLTIFFFVVLAAHIVSSGTSVHVVQPPPPAAVYGVAPQTIQATAIIVQPSFGPYPMQVTCPNCNATLMSETSATPGLLTWLLSGGLIVFGCWLGCCLIPCCIPECQVCFLMPECWRIFLIFDFYLFYRILIIDVPTAKWFWEHTDVCECCLSLIHFLRPPFSLSRFFFIFLFFKNFLPHTHIFHFPFRFPPFFQKIPCLIPYDCWIFLFFRDIFSLFCLKTNKNFTFWFFQYLSFFE